MLTHIGWSYNYLAPENLNSSYATVESGILAPEGASWKALVVQKTANVSLEAIETIARLATSGLPTKLVGGLPGFYPTGSQSNISL